MKKNLMHSLMLLAAVMGGCAKARSEIHVVGSGTVYPFTTLVAEQFGQQGNFKTPIVEATGTGGGFKLFCSGAGADTPDINDASRRITDSEKAQCVKNGVTDSVEIPIGYDGIVMAVHKGTLKLNLTRKQIFMALARELPGKNGKPVLNPNRTWKDVDASLPDWPIRVYGPGTVSGTRDTFVDLVMDKGCAQLETAAKAWPDAEARKMACHMVREDGGYVEMGEDYNILVQKLDADNEALGIFGYSFYQENRAKIEAASIEGVIPDGKTIESGQYSISRRLYVYLKQQHIGMVPGLVEFIHELTSDNAIGADGYVIEKGLLPLNEADRKAMRDIVSKIKTH